MAKLRAPESDPLRPALAAQARRALTATEALRGALGRIFPVTDLRVDRHLGLYGPKPTLTNGAGINTSIVIGTDSGGGISITTTGAPPAAGAAFLTVTFNSAFNTPTSTTTNQGVGVQLTAAGGGGYVGGYGCALVVTGNYVTGFQIYPLANLPATQTMSIAYLVYGINVL